MPYASPSQHALARRALIEDIKQDKRGWLQHGVAALAVSLLGIGVAGSVALTGAAQPSGTAPATSASDVQDTAVSADRTAGTSRDEARGPVSAAKLDSLADQRAEELRKAEDDIQQAAKTKAAQARSKALASASKATRDKAGTIAEQERRARSEARSAAKATAKATAKARAAAPSRAKASSGGSGRAATRQSTGGAKSCMPVTSGYRVAARFGQVGKWARYHTGYDFSAPIGTPIHAPAAGVVENAGSGPASGWAGTYVVIRYPDGTQSLMAHMSTVSVSVGQSVAACQTVGAIGMTGRTFGPHVHFEIYPAGVAPGDIYRAVDPVRWLAAHSLRP